MDIIDYTLPILYFYCACSYSLKWSGTEVPYGFLSTVLFSIFVIPCAWAGVQLWNAGSLYSGFSLYTIALFAVARTQRIVDDVGTEDVLSFFFVVPAIIGSLIVAPYIYLTAEDPSQEELNRGIALALEEELEVVVELDSLFLYHQRIKEIEMGAAQTKRIASIILDRLDEIIISRKAELDSLAQKSTRLASKMERFHHILSISKIRVDSLSSQLRADRHEERQDLAYASIVSLLTGLVAGFITGGFYFTLSRQYQKHGPNGP